MAMTDIRKRDCKIQDKNKKGVYMNSILKKMKQTVREMEKNNPKFKSPCPMSLKQIHRSRMDSINLNISEVARDLAQHEDKEYGDWATCDNLKKAIKDNEKAIRKIKKDVDRFLGNNFKDKKVELTYEEIKSLPIGMQKKLKELLEHVTLFLKTGDSGGYII